MEDRRSPAVTKFRFLDSTVIERAAYRRCRLGNWPLLSFACLLSAGPAAGQTLQPPANALPAAPEVAEEANALIPPQDPSASSEADVPEQVLDPLTAEQTRQLVDLVLYLLRANVPESFVDDDEWGRQKKVYSGVRLKFDDGKLKTKRRWKTVNHGRWRIFSAELADPENPSNLRIEATDLKWDGQRKLQWQLHVDARLSVLARQSRWNYGVRLFSMHVDAEAWLRLVLEGSVEVDVDYTKIPPDLVLRPHVQAADLQLQKFEVDEVGHLGGDVAEALGKASEGILRRRVIEPQRKRLPEKINQQLEKKQDKLRLSLSDWIADWLQLPDEGS